MIHEHQFLTRLRSSREPTNPKVALGMGDDCAILRIPAGHETLITADFSLEGIHFRRDWQSPECIGHRCLARGLSDIAAMGGVPIAAFLSLALPAALPRRWVNRFLSGLLGLARMHGLDLAGGDTAESPSGVLADIMVVGSVKRERALLRSGAKVGDFIYVTGELGESAAALYLLAGGMVEKRDVFPYPKIAVGEWLVRNRIANSAIDISDGLSTDLSHICEESGVGATIDAEAIPIHSAARRLPTSYRTRSDLPFELSVHGGEDYQLLFTAPKSKNISGKIAGVKVTKIGEILREKKMFLIQNGKRTLLLPHGWEHFQPRRQSLKP